ncbi:MAG TPA: fumarylacetoacetate hydrolase family protein [Micromonosporaceae bacterium]|nr:fumarylacetoacetate hydrolase family protein [Micromonosporaceae bacterium]
MPTALYHLRSGTASRWAVRRDGAWSVLEHGLADLLAMPLAQARGALDGASPTGPLDVVGTLPPVDRQEVWAAGVTYQRSREGRKEESAGAGGLYDLVYDSDRPEIFFKASPWRVVGDGDSVGIRADSTWDVPEAELALVVNAAGELFGYTLGNDMSSRSIEGDNPLYLPQAKIYDRSCALGPAIVPAWEAGPGPFELAVEVLRDGAPAYAGTTSTAAMARGLDDLVDWLYRALRFPTGAVLLTGTGVVPGADFTVWPGDTIVISSPALGTLSNPVVSVGREGTS